MVYFVLLFDLAPWNKRVFMFWHVNVDNYRYATMAGLQIAILSWLTFGSHLLKPGESMNLRLPVKLDSKFESAFLTTGVSKADNAECGGGTRDLDGVGTSVKL